MHLDVLALNLLHRCSLQGMVLPILAELREAGADIINEQLRQLLVGLDDEAKEFAVIVVHNIPEFLLERERLEVFPS